MLIFSLVHQATNEYICTFPETCNMCVCVYIHLEVHNNFVLDEAMINFSYLIPKFNMNILIKKASICLSFQCKNKSSPCQCCIRIAVSSCTNKYICISYFYPSYVIFHCC